MYVIGQWVRGEKFYGRRLHREKLLGKEGWLGGLRRVGKTSLLRQLELETRRLGHSGLFLDLQGVDDREDLGRALADAWLDAGVAAGPEGVGGLARWLDARGALPFWLFLDEADEVLSSPSLAQAVAELVAVVRGHAAGRLVVASSLRLVDRGVEFPWLTGLGPPLWLGSFSRAESESLVRQDQLPPAARPAFSAAEVEAICAACGDHPMLVPLLAKRTLESGSVEAGIQRLVDDPTLDRLFAVDLDLLSPLEREALSGLAQGRSAEAPVRLVDLGLVQGGAVSNRFFARWLDLGSTLRRTS
jgi:hypothetical protein